MRNRIQGQSLLNLESTSTGNVIQLSPIANDAKTAEKRLEDMEELEREVHRDRNAYTPETLIRI